MKIKLIFLLLATLLNAEILNYKIEKKEYIDKNVLMVIIRSFEENNQNYYLTLNTNTFEVKKESKDKIDKNFKITNLKEFYNSKFFKVLNFATKKVKSGGIESELNEDSSVYLTVDMCPSSKKDFEREFFEKTIKLKNEIKLIPISIAISGRWIKKHQKEFKWLVSSDLNITWINHTYSHFYDKNLSIEKNFLLSRNTNLNFEILGLEKLLLENGLLPSAFIRFPGLICDENIMKRLREEFLLIPIASNAWIAKKQKIKKGSFILVHGNLNEHRGIEMLMDEYKNFTYTISPLAKAFK